ncbi:hypothetical protein Pla52n_69910 [Stieleria varia]|uniref:Uncharacterized protein n=1 Tax=Stieleria varia TaxID=2528005 RepID=A0A5C5ZLE8_9BACT|nr:hypothetical protein Pla52n_69910 [Stieleria varia]
MPVIVYRKSATSVVSRCLPQSGRPTVEMGGPYFVMHSMTYGYFGPVFFCPHIFLPQLSVL